MKINNTKSMDRVNQIYNNSAVKAPSKEGLPKQGEVIKGEIIDLQHNNVKIRLTNGQIIEAKMTDSFEFFIGQKLEFLIKESSTEQLLLKPLVEEGVNLQNKLIQILENAGITVNKENLEVVAKLLENNMPVDKETLLKIIPYTKQLDTSIDNILFLVKNNIPVNQSTIEQLVRMQEGNNQLVQNLAAMSDDLSGMLKEGISSELAKILLKDNPIAQNIFESLKQQILAIGSNTEGLLPETETFLKTLNESSNTAGATSQNQVTGQQLNQALATEGSLLSQEELLLQQKGAINNATNTTTNSSVNSGIIIQEEALNLTSTPNQVTGEQIHKEVQLSTILSSNELMSLETQINGALKAETKNSVVNFQDMTIETLFKEINKMDITPELKDKIIQLAAGKITYTLFSQELFANKTQLESPAKLNEFYEKLHDKVLNLLDLDIKNVEGNTAHLAKDAHQIKNAIEFMNDLNQRYNYIQLPMLLGDRLQHSELYILNDKHKLKNNKGTLTALIRLDMVNLGHLDIYVTKAEKNVTIQFFTENQEKSAMIEDKVFTMHNQLSKLGFKVLGISVVKKEKDFDVAEDFLKREEVHEVKRFTFDMRA